MTGLEQPPGDRFAHLPQPQHCDLHVASLAFSGCSVNLTPPVAAEIVMPRLSDSMEEGTVAKWLVEVGAEVTRGLPIVEIDTDKATMEYEAERAGTLLQIVVAEGETAPIGATIAWIGESGETVEPPGNTVLQAPAPAAETAARNTVSQASPRVNASPIAEADRRAARGRSERACRGPGRTG